MMKLLFTLFVLSVAYTVNSQEKTTIVQSGIKVSSVNKEQTKAVLAKNVLKIKDILGKERAELISKAKKVTFFRVKEFVTDKASQQKARKKYFVDYEVLKSAKLDKKQSKELKKILLDANNYADPNLINKCTFTATIGMEIKVGKKSIKAILSYACEEILFLEDGEELYRGVNSVKLFNQIAQKFFKDLPIAEDK